MLSDKWKGTEIKIPEVDKWDLFHTRGRRWINYLFAAVIVIFILFLVYCSIAILTDLPFFKKRKFYRNTSIPPNSLIQQTPKEVVNRSGFTAPVVTVLDTPDVEVAGIQSNRVFYRYAIQFFEKRNSGVTVTTDNIEQEAIPYTTPFWSSWTLFPANAVGSKNNPVTLSIIVALPLEIPSLNKDLQSQGKGLLAVVNREFGYSNRVFDPVDPDDPSDAPNFSTGLLTAQNEFINDLRTSDIAFIDNDPNAPQLFFKDTVEGAATLTA